MSKRKSQTAVAAYVAQGYIPEAFINYLALLGWSSGTDEDLFTFDELIERFDLDRVQRAGAVFDRERLDWVNGQWIRRLSDDDLVERAAAVPRGERPGAARRPGAPVRLPTADDVTGAAADRPRAAAAPRRHRSPGRLRVPRRRWS